MKKMRIRIGRDGRTTITVEGAAGPECLEFTKNIEQAVGVIDKRVLTADYQKEPLPDPGVILSEEERL